MGVSESEIFFRKAGGHRHDGSTSSLIDYTKYSIFDFDTSSSTNGQDRARDTVRQNNQSRFDQYIAAFIATQILEPAGIVLLENSVRGIHIGADEITANNIAAETITANEIAANTITSAQIAANTITADDLVASIVLVNNTISSAVYTAGSAGWIIRNNGFAEFNNVTVRGAVSANTGNIGGFTIGTTTLTAGSGTTTVGVSTGADTSSIAFYTGSATATAAPFRAYNNGRIIAGGGTVDIATTGGITISGVLSVSNTANISGDLNVTGTTVNLGGALSTTTVAGTLTVNSTTTIAGNVTINGTITANSTANLNGTTNVGGNLTVNGTGTINGALTVNNTVTVSNTITRTGAWTLGSTGFTAGSFSIDVVNGIRIADGSNIAPAFSFANATSTGIYRNASGHLSLSAGGVNSAFFTPTDTLLQITNTGAFQTVYWTAFGLTKAASTRDIKNNIDYYSNGIEKIKKLKPVTFTYKATTSDSEYVSQLKQIAVQHGFVAEDVAEADPQLAVWGTPDLSNLDDDEKVSIMSDLNKYIPTYYKETGILSVAVAAIKELVAKVEALEQKLGYNS